MVELRHFTLKEIQEHFAVNLVTAKNGRFFIEPSGFFDGEEQFSISETLPVMECGLPFDLTMPVNAEFADKTLMMLGVFDSFQAFDIAHVRFGNFEISATEGCRDSFHLVDPRTANHIQILVFRDRVMASLGLMNHVYLDETDCLENAIKMTYITSQTNGMEMLDLIYSCPFHTYNLRKQIAQQYHYI